jgi:hypothetical protein
MNAVLTAIDTLGKDSFVAPVMYLYAQQMGHDLEYLTINGPKNMEGGGKFYHKHRDFFEKFKADPKGVDAMQQFRIIQEMLEHKLEKGIRKYIEETVEGAQISAAALHMGQVDSAVMHYLSVRIPKRVLVEQVNKMGPEDLMMGYAMHNCLEMIDLMRFHANPDARVYALWLNGQRVGMSYDLEIAQEANGQEPVKAPLIDSVEFSDEFFKAFRALYGAVEEGTGKPIKIPDMLPAKMFVTGYLFSRLQQSEKGIYVLPESNNIHVRAAMREFIGLYGGKPVLGYNGVRLKTDTDFTHMPFWIDKSAIEGQVQSAWFDTDLKVAKPGTPAFENNPMISDAANEQLRTAYRQIEESTSGKHADVSAKELFPNL